MHQWLAKRGSRAFGPESAKGPSYLGANTNQPFPNNPFFRSEPVLSRLLQIRIWEKVVKDGEAIKSVSQEFGVDVRRVAAVVRLKQVEAEMKKNVSFDNFLRGLPIRFYFVHKLFACVMLCLYVMRLQHFISISLEDFPVVRTVISLKQKSLSSRAVRTRRLLDQH
jgi:hypothetical protein